MHRDGATPFLHFERREVCELGGTVRRRALAGRGNGEADRTLAIRCDVSGEG
jgi:hypothetical protein